VLHHDGRWSHEGQPLLNRKLVALFDRSVRYLPEAGVHVVQIQRFRGQIEVEEAGFFVRSFDPDSGEIALSDGSREPLAVASLGVSERDGALLCRVKADLAPGGLLARFHHAAQAELLHAVDDAGPEPALRVGGVRRTLPPL
jgi:hypothetical protein